MKAKISVFAICVEAIIYFFNYIICMTVPLMHANLFNMNVNYSIYRFFLFSTSKQRPNPR